MQPDKFKVIYCGRLIEGFTAEQASEGLCRLFKLNPATAQKIVASSKEVVLKPGAEHKAAYRMKGMLQEVGLEARLERVTVAQAKPKPAIPTEQNPNNSATQSQPASDAPAAPTFSSKLALVEDDSIDPKGPGFCCPKCGKEQKKESSCIACGVFFAKLEQTEDTGFTPAYASSGAVEATANEPPKRNIKGILAGTAGIAGAAFLVIKKFKLAKIAALLGIAGVSWVFDSITEESLSYCLGDQYCESIVEENAEPCWQSSGMDQYDWDAMEYDEFEAHYAELEQSFFGCFRDDHGDRLLLEPAWLTGWLIELCEYDDSCIRQAGKQQKSCYSRHSISAYKRELTDLHIDTIMQRYQPKLESYFSCYTDDAGAPLFDVEYWFAE
ncbi:MAG: hypothetical protein DHS20C11_04370 [Lysobacteraceae bacterium]|nr:MAG: hypothetical protein DHS20C11_04370 [Xanthomonadaceae bacterium]